MESCVARGCYVFVRLCFDMIFSYMFRVGWAEGLDGGARGVVRRVGYEGVREGGELRLDGWMDGWMYINI